MSFVDSSIVFGRVFGVFAAALLVGCAADSSSANDDQSASAGDVSGQEIKSGTSASAYTEAALIDTDEYYCSGSLIAPRIVLTAGHCVAADSYTVTLPYANKSARGTKTWTKYKSTGESVNPNAIDVAVIILDSPINLSFYPKLASSAVADGTKGINVGRIRNNVLSSSQLFKGASVALEPSADFPFDYETKDIIQSGDSGGPVYVGSGASRKIVAVNSGASSSTQVLARVDLVYSQIQTLIQQNGGSGN